MRIANVIHDSIVDGPGLRFVVFTQGCPHHCPGCHNPETLDPAGGSDVPLEALLDPIGKDPLTEGLTLTGGEPFSQAEDCARLASAAKRVGWTVWVYSGYTFDAIRASKRPDWNALLETVDVLVDGPYIEKERDLQLLYRGSRNQRLIDVPKSLKAGHVVLWKRKDDLGHFSVPES